MEKSEGMKLSSRSHTALTRRDVVALVTAVVANSAVLVAGCQIYSGDSIRAIATTTAGAAALMGCAYISLRQRPTERGTPSVDLQPRAAPQADPAPPLDLAEKESDA